MKNCMNCDFRQHEITEDPCLSCNKNLAMPHWQNWEGDEVIEEEVVNWKLWSAGLIIWVGFTITLVLTKEYYLLILSFIGAAMFWSEQKKLQPAKEED